ncbi:MAG: DUF1295 domain-containing protein [Polyangiaceae bacterium]|nr:DUF1295 domain-containing protein [Polyangiaceae bacterium]
MQSSAFLTFLSGAGLFEYLGLHFAISLVVSAAGFYRIYYFVSLGYAFSIALMALVTPWLFRSTLDLWTALQCTGLLAYGMRLGSFLIRRERSPAYQKEMVEVIKRGEHIKGFVKLMIWLSVALLYVLMFSPALFALLHHRDVPGSSPLVSQFSGLFIMACGLFIESWADHQKSAYKAQRPDRFCDVGLYRVVRCPNYLGEVIFWVGAWTAGISAYTHVLHWGMSLTGLVCIVLVMLGSTRRLEMKQDERYGSNPEYQRYTRSVPVLFPFVPVYSFKNLKVYLG